MGHKKIDFRWLRLITLPLLAISMAGCALFFGDDSVECAAHITEAWQITPPASATDVNERCANGFNPTYEVNFSIAAEDARAFMDSTLLTNWQSTPLAGVFDEDTARAQSYFVGSYGDGAVYIESFIDTSDPQKYRVHYVATFVD
jgi:hypothetical protein